MTIATLNVTQDDNRIIGKTIWSSNLRAIYGVNVLAIKRGQKYLTEITPQTIILQNDLLYVFGTPEKINNLSKCIRA